jgi:hypothetical protein
VNPLRSSRRTSRCKSFKICSWLAKARESKFGEYERKNKKDSRVRGERVLTVKSSREVVQFDVKFWRTSERSPFSRAKVRSQWTSRALIHSVGAYRGMTSNDGTKPIYRKGLKDFIHLDRADFAKITRNWASNWRSGLDRKESRWSNIEWDLIVHVCTPFSMSDVIRLFELMTITRVAGIIRNGSRLLRSAMRSCSRAEGRWSAILYKSNAGLRLFRGVEVAEDTQRAVFRTMSSPISLAWSLPRR